MLGTENWIALQITEFLVHFRNNKRTVLVPLQINDFIDEVDVLQNTSMRLSFANTRERYKTLMVENRIDKLNFYVQIFEKGLLIHTDPKRLLLRVVSPMRES